MRAIATAVLPGKLPESAIIQFIVIMNAEPASKGQLHRMDIVIVVRPISGATLKPLQTPTGGVPPSGRRG